MSLILRIITGFVGAILVACGAPAMAQTTTYSNSTTGAINDATCGTAGVVTRTFVVGTSYIVSDVNLGVLLSHTYRSDLRITLTSPAGTTVAIMTNTGGSGDNVNDLFDDAATANISTHNGTVTDGATAPPYSHSYRPSAALSAFNGQNASGTWTLTICDGAGGDTGTFTRADLYITQVPTNYADLSLTKTVSNASPTNGAAISYTLTASNAASSPQTATGVQVTDVLPGGFTYISASGTGSYNSATGVWSVGTLAPGASASITLSGTVNATSGATIANAAEITASSVPDIDSTVNNGGTSEDDDAQASFTVSGTRSAGIAPTLTCPVGTALFDWDANVWSAGSTNNSYSVTNLGTVGFGITNQGAWLNNATYGGQSPAEQTVVTGAIPSAGQSLFLYPDFATAAQISMTTITLPVAVPGLQFTVLDVDYNAAQFADRIKVTGTLAGVPVSATLTNNLANYVSGDTAYGDQLSTDTQANGNVVVTFASKVDTVIIEYGNHSLSPSDPGGQAIALHDITFCRPVADLSLTKTVSNATPATGSAISYTLTATNAATSSATATGITAIDTLPAGFTFVSATGTGTYTSGTGVWAIGSLAPGASATLTINGTVSATAGQTVTNVTQITASSWLDNDSTVNNGVTTEDDYASVAFTASAATINCPAGSTATGSGFASAGTGSYLEQIFWLDWNCGATTTFSSGATVNKTWDAGNGLVITGMLTGLTASVSPYSTGAWGGDLLDNRYNGVNPIGLRNTNDGEDPQFTLTLTATLNGVAVPLRYVAADAESTDGSNEGLAAATNGSAWQLLEQEGAMTVNNSGSSFTLTDLANAGNGTAILETSGSSVAMSVTISGGGVQSMAFGVFTPYDYSDGPLTGTTYGAARHRTIAPIRLGASFTTETTAYDSPSASADVDNGVAMPTTVTASQPYNINVTVAGGGYLSAWLDWNDDGDFADSGEQIATNAVDGGAGDADATVNGVIKLSGTAPGVSGTALTIARFRYAATTGASASGLGGFGEVEDYAVAIAANAQLTVAKTSSPYDDGVNPAYNLPGQDVVYSIAITNTLGGTTTADTVVVIDPLPSNVTFFNGDANGAAAGTDAVVFTDALSGLTYSYASDVGYATGPTPPANFAACSYTPAAGYDPAVRYICINPKGVMNGTATTPTPHFTLSFRAKVN